MYDKFYLGLQIVLRSITNHTRRAVALIKLSIVSAILVTASLIPTIALTGTAHADVSCSPDSVNLSGSSWLTSLSGGVNVCSADEGNTNVCVPVSGAPYDATHCSSYGSQGGYVWSGTEWQCVELVNRLYLTKGWTTATWYGDGDTLINHVPPNLTEENDGHISYLNPGDVITFTYGTDGHAGIINTVGSSINIINQNTSNPSDVNSYGHVASGTSFSAGNADIDMTGWAGYDVQAVVHRPVTPPPASPLPLRIGTLNSDGHYYVKESNLNNGWTDETPGGGATAGYLSGDVIGAIVGGHFNVKEGSLDAGWVDETPGGGADAGAVSDETNSTPLRIGVLESGHFYVKEGSLDASWTDETPGGGAVAAYLSGSRIGVVMSDGTFNVKDGTLDASWTTEDTGISKGVLSGSLIGEITTGGDFKVKQGGLSAQWTDETPGGGASDGELSDATSNTQLRIGYVSTGGTFYVKEGSLTASWSTMATVNQGVISGGLVGALEGNTLYVKQGSLNNGWTTESTSSTQGSLWSL